MIINEIKSKLFPKQINWLYFLQYLFLVGNSLTTCFPLLQLKKCVNSNFKTENQNNGHI